MLFCFTASFSHFQVLHSLLQSFSGSSQALTCKDRSLQTPGLFSQHFLSCPQCFMSRYRQFTALFSLVSACLLMFCNYSLDPVMVCANLAETVLHVHNSCNSFCFQFCLWYWFSFWFLKNLLRNIPPLWRPKRLYLPLLHQQSSTELVCHGLLWRFSRCKLCKGPQEPRSWHAAVCAPKKGLSGLGWVQNRSG